MGRHWWQRALVRRAPNMTGWRDPGMVLCGLPIVVPSPGGLRSLTVAKRGRRRRLTEAYRGGLWTSSAASGESVRSGSGCPGRRV